MNKLLSGITIGIVCGSLGGYFISEYTSIPRNHVRVAIVNSSGQTIKKIILSHGNTIYTISELSDKNDTKIIFTNPGESSYKLTAILENDSSVVSTEAYIEGGYKMTETVTANGIETTYK